MRIASQAELHRHIDEVRMSPAGDGENWCYFAEGEVDLLGSDYSVDPRRRVLDRRLEVVAGVRFELTTFGFELARVSLEVS